MLKAMFNGAEKYLAENYSLHFFQYVNFNCGKYEIFFFNANKFAVCTSFCKSDLRKILIN